MTRVLALPLEAMLGKGMAAELIYANVGMPPDITDKLIEAVNDCGKLPASCHFKVALAVAWPFAEYREDTKPAAEVLWRAYLEAQALYIGAYAEPEPGQHRDVAGHDDELVFKLARFEREQCPE